MVDGPVVVDILVVLILELLTVVDRVVWMSVELVERLAAVVD